MCLWKWTGGNSVRPHTSADMCTPSACCSQPFVIRQALRPVRYLLQVSLFLSLWEFAFYQWLLIREVKAEPLICFFKTYEGWVLYPSSAVTGAQNSSWIFCKSHQSIAPTTLKFGGGVWGKVFCRFYALASHENPRSVLLLTSWQRGC